MGRQNVEDIYPLSPMQQGMLFHSLESPHSGVYFEQFNFTLHGQLNSPAFRQSWQQVVARHAVLRTSFLWENLESPLQVVSKQVTLPWVEQDWRELTPAEQQAQLQGFLQADVEKGFDLRRSPLMRCALFHLEEGKYQFVWSHHHSLMDGWCLTILTQEVLGCYEALTLGKAIALQTPQPYRSYIAWLQAQDRSQAEAFWRQNLAGFEAPTSLGIDRGAIGKPRSAATYLEHRISCSESVTDCLRDLSQTHH
ncbi:MAG: hypothetical protein HC769_18105 [Cyanobacteria bacterium CRU_2_1]|nr:hypothetical protein [Cyanobacteria bacterium CRU_2_1]